MVSVRVTPVVDECGSFGTVDGEPEPVPVPAVLDVDDGSGYTVRIAYGPGPERAYEIRSLAVIAGERAPSVGAAALREVRLSLVVLCARHYLANAHRMTELWGGLADAKIEYEPDPGVGEPFIQHAEFIERAQRANGPRVVRAGLPEEIEPISKPQMRALRKKGPSSPEAIELVGKLAAYANSQGIGVVRFVQEHLGLSQSTASNWVSIARKAGAVTTPTRRKPLRLGDSRLDESSLDG
jgi:DNA-binding transcriptional ArsR family regulator